MARSAASKKKVTKKANPALAARRRKEVVALVRKLLMPKVCMMWQKRIREAASYAAMKKLWDGADYGDRHSALFRIYGGDDATCPGCGMTADALEAMTFAQFVRHLRAAAKQAKR